MTYSEFCSLPEGQTVKVSGATRPYRTPYKVGPTLAPRQDAPEGLGLLHYPGKQLDERVYIEIHRMTRVRNRSNS